MARLNFLSALLGSKHQSNLLMADRRAQFIAAYVFPEGVTNRIKKRYPHITQAEIELTLAALRDFFLIHLRSFF